MTRTAVPPRTDPSPADEGLSPDDRLLIRRSPLVRLGHVLAWTVLFYLLTYGIAKLCEWLSRR